MMFWKRDRRTRVQEAGGSRSFEQAVTDFGGGLPIAAPVSDTSRHRDDVSWPLRTNGRGAFETGRGWSVVKEAPLRVYRATTDEVGVLTPWLSTPELPATGVPMGLNARSGSGFFADLARWVVEGYVSNPNVMVFGKPGMGKSGTVKAFARRDIFFGTPCLIAGDLKEEYFGLCGEFGVDPVILGPGLAARINALEAGPLVVGWDSLTEGQRRARFDDIRARWLVLLEALLDTMGVQVTTTVQQTLVRTLDEMVGADRSSLGTAPDVIVPEVWEAFRNPSEAILTEGRFRDEHDYFTLLRPAIDGLGQLCTGPLRGLFDARTNIQLDWDAPIQDISLKRIKALGDQVVGLSMTVLNSWTRAMTDSANRTGNLNIVRDEVWRQMRLGAGAVKSLDADLRLSRDDRTRQLLALHKPSDLGSVGDVGSEAHSIARDLWALCDTKILLAQEREVAEEVQTQLGLTDLETAQMADWCWKRKGRALWKVGDTSFKVETVLSGIETEMFETNDAEHPQHDGAEVA